MQGTCSVVCLGLESHADERGWLGHVKVNAMSLSSVADPAGYQMLCCQVPSFADNSSQCDASTSVMDYLWYDTVLTWSCVILKLLFRPPYGCAALYHPPTLVTTWPRLVLLYSACPGHGGVLCKQCYLHDVAIWSSASGQAIGFSCTTGNGREVSPPAGVVMYAGLTVCTQYTDKGFGA